MSLLALLFSVLLLLGNATERVRLGLDSPLIERIPFATGFQIRQIIVHSWQGHRLGIVLMLEDGSVLHAVLTSSTLEQYRHIARNAEWVTVDGEFFVVHGRDGGSKWYSLKSLRAEERASFGGEDKLEPSEPVVASIEPWTFTYGGDVALFRKRVNRDLPYEVDLNIGVERVIHAIAFESEFLVFARSPNYRPSMANLPSGQSTYVVTRVPIAALEMLLTCK